MTTRSRPWAVALALSLPAAVSADVVHLRNGGRISGIIVERTDRTVVLEIGPGRVSVPLSRVERIEDSQSALQTFHQRAAELDPLDAAGWARLARWAQDHDLATTARETWERVLALDPDHPEANAALGRYSVDGEWMAEAEARRRLGYVPWEGGWVSPAEHEALVREREAERQDLRERREAELRVREAEARAREAEARARQAEADAEQAEEAGYGIPYDWVIYGGSGGVWFPGGSPPHFPPPDRPPHGGHPGPDPPPVATPHTPSSIGPVSTGATGTRGGLQAPEGDSRHRD